MVKSNKNTIKLVIPAAQNKDIKVKTDRRVITMCWRGMTYQSVKNIIQSRSNCLSSAKTSSLSHPIVINSRHDRAEKITYF